MFGWLKRRMHQEHRKLAYQNFEAAHDPEMKTLAGLKGEWAAYDSYDNACKLSSEFILRMSEPGGTKPDDIDAALKLNKELRRIFDAIGRKDRGDFDRVYRPLGGWPDYFEQSPNETYLMEQQRQIDAEIAAFAANDERSSY